MNLSTIPAEKPVDKLSTTNAEPDPMRVYESLRDSRPEISRGWFIAIVFVLGFVLGFVSFPLLLIALDSPL